MELGFTPTCLVHTGSLHPDLLEAKASLKAPLLQLNILDLGIQKMSLNQYISKGKKVLCFRGVNNSVIPRFERFRLNKLAGVNTSVLT